MISCILVPIGKSFGAIGIGLRARGDFRSSLSSHSFSQAFMWIWIDAVPNSLPLSRNYHIWHIIALGRMRTVEFLNSLEEETWPSGLFIGFFKEKLADERTVGDLALTFRGLD